MTIAFIIGAFFGCSIGFLISAVLLCDGGHHELNDEFYDEWGNDTCDYE